MRRTGPGVLNIGKLSAHGGDYYLSVVASGIEDYYLGAGEAPGRWHGTGSHALNLAGTVAADDLEAILAHHDPRSGTPLRANNKPSTVPAFDLTFRAPKSVSLLWAMADPDTAEQIRGAHDDAVTDVLAWLETDVLRTRIGPDRTRVATGGAVAAAFRHRTSRAGDPLLHTHLLIANLAAGPDGRWRTLDGQLVYRHAKTAGYLYQAALRHHLTSELGLAWEPVRNGVADLHGVDRAVIEHFSQRRSQILRMMATRGTTSAAAAQTAALATRQAKTMTVDGASLTARWHRQGHAVGFGPDHAMGLLHHETRRGLDQLDIAATLAHLTGPDGLTNHASTFTRNDVIRAWCEQLPRGAPLTQIISLADATIQQADGQIVSLDRTLAVTGPQQVMAALRTHLGDDQLLEAVRLQRGVAAVLADTDATPEQLTARLLDGGLDDAHDPAAVLAWRLRREADTHGISLPNTTTAGQPEARYSTTELLTTEWTALNTIAAQPTAPTIPTTTAEQVIEQHAHLADEQQAMVRRLLTDPAAVQAVVGPAGTGKTTALTAAVHAWHAHGHTVISTALAARTALQLGEETGTTPVTLARLLGDLDHHCLRSSDVIIVDEAGMVGTRELARLIGHTTTAGAKVVLVGDHRQLPEIDAGGLFRAIVQQTPAIHLTTNRRQRDAAERDAVNQLRTGKPSPRFTTPDRLHTAPDHHAAVAATVNGWLTDHQDGQSTLMLASTNDHVDALNTAARTALRQAGLLPNDEQTFGNRAYTTGDQIMCLRNNPHLGVVNGTTATVRDHATDGLLIHTTDGRDIHLPARYATEHLTHAYATTVHKAQGRTLDTTHILLDDLTSQEATYVMLSRHRDTTTLYATDDPRLEHRPSRAQQLALDQMQR